MIKIIFATLHGLLSTVVLFLVRLRPREKARPPRPRVKADPVPAY